MAESFVDPSSIRFSHRNRPRRPQTKPACQYQQQEPVHEDDDDPLKIILKKRQPRRPRLSDGSLLLPSTSESPAQSRSFRFLDGEIGSAKQYFTGHNHLEMTREQLSRLSVNEISSEQSSSAFDTNRETSEDPSTVENYSPSNTNRKERKRPRIRTKKKKYQINNDNSLDNSVPDVEIIYDDDDAGPSNNVDAAESIINQTEEIKENNFLSKGLQKNKKLFKSANNVQQENSKSNLPPTRKELRDKKKKEKKIFNEHLPIEVVRKLLAVQNPDIPNIIEGCIRINPRCYQNAYISLTNDNQDVVIVGLKDRNRALEGDLVAVVINAKDKWFKVGENNFQKTGTVVSILETAHPRKAVGYLKKQDVFVFFQPRDSRVPIMKIGPKSVPKNFYDNPEIYENTLFLCKIVDWKNVAFAEGEIESVVGNKGDLKIETDAILLENDLILTPYPDELLVDLPSADYSPTEIDLLDREDLRKTCIFTIDPATAVDLDDALSCKPLVNGNFEIGIHISDVTHYLKAFSSLDRVVAERATTVYMVDNVYHMLPKQLCLVCSLLPGQDKLAFSVILEVTPQGEIIKRRFCKSVINSCCQMSYQQAQIMIDNEEHDWEKNGPLKICGDYTPADLTKIVRNLYQISRHLKQKRFDEGALKIDQAKLYVSLNEDGIPVSYSLEEKRESNSLIEEFMLLANMEVARHLFDTMPEVSLLRSHSPPTQRTLKKTQELLTKFGVVLDVESAGTLHNSLMSWHQACTNDGPNGTDVSQYKWMVINSLCAKSMLRAVYRCSSEIKSQDDLRHYALNVAFYTHFTSPIRRYPDCIVHRLLHASMKNLPLPDEWTSALCKSVAKNCNTKKHAAKQAQEQSNILFFTYLLDLQGSMNVQAIVTDIKERSVDTMLCETGLKVRLYFDDTLEETTNKFSFNQEVPSVKLTWKERKIVQEINIFSILNVKIAKHAQMFKLQGMILPPVPLEDLAKI